MSHEIRSLGSRPFPRFARGLRRGGANTRPHTHLRVELLFAPRAFGNYNPDQRRKLQAESREHHAPHDFL
jgi:hypothetical protein